MHRHLTAHHNLNPPLQISEVVCIAIFTVEYLSRACTVGLCNRGSDPVRLSILRAARDGDADVYDHDVADNGRGRRGDRGGDGNGSVTVTRGPGRLVHRASQMGVGRVARKVEVEFEGQVRQKRANKPTLP